MATGRAASQFAALRRNLVRDLAATVSEDGRFFGAIIDFVSHLDSLANEDCMTPHVNRRGTMQIHRRRDEVLYHNYVVSGPPFRDWQGREDRPMHCTRCGAYSKENTVAVYRARQTARLIQNFINGSKDASK